jgi:hypothetical protein
MIGGRAHSFTLEASKEDTGNTSAHGHQSDDGRKVNRRLHLKFNGDDHLSNLVEGARRATLVGRKAGGQRTAFV